MKTGFYPKLAASSIQKNKQMFTPYILTCMGMVAIFYIILFLAVSDAITPLRGSETLRQVFSLGSWVIAIFSGIFLFYTNSFLIRRRKKEFGLYNILGMGKGNISRILFWETLIIALFSIGMGLFVGIVLSKLAELGLANIMHGPIVYDMSVSILAVKRSIQIFGAIFIFLLLNSIRQVKFSSAISLLRSENMGEKPPKGNWLIGSLGILLLAAAYYLAVTIKTPITALTIFFIAVIMVVIGTYLVMISGSVVFCRLLQKKKSYYYKPNHFISVSSMVYRMKRNGAGLASICILATMILVMMASSACLYFGEESAINGRYPRDINLDFRTDKITDFSDHNTENLKEGFLAELKAYGIVPKNDYFFRHAQLSGVLQNDYVEVDPDKITAEEALNTMHLFYFIPLQDYNAVMGTDETLNDGEVLLCTGKESYHGDTLSFHHGNTFKIKKQVSNFTGLDGSAMDIISSIVIIVPDLEKSIEGLDSLALFRGERLLTLEWKYNFDTGTDPEEQIALYHNLFNFVTDPSTKEKLGYTSCYLSCREYERQDFYSMFGGLFYIGILLSTVFILACVLIIYYKQISEGYEDQMRFEIMQKVGMTKREIRKSINSQLLTVFFLPLVFAALHLAFAFPIIQKLLLMFNLNHVLLFAVTTLISMTVFAILYTIVYRLTSNAYYNIVSGAKEDA